MRIKSVFSVLALLALPFTAVAQGRDVRDVSKFCLRCFGDEAVKQAEATRSACQVCAWQLENGRQVRGSVDGPTCARLVELNRRPGENFAFAPGTVEDRIYQECAAARCGDTPCIVFKAASERPAPADRLPVDQEALQARKDQLAERARALRAARERTDQDRAALEVVDTALAEADRAAAEAAAYDSHGRLLIGSGEECPAGVICAPRDQDQRSAFTVGAGGVGFHDFGSGAGVQLGADLDLKSTTWSPTLRVAAGGLDLDADADKFVCIQAGALTPIARESAVSIGGLAGWCGRGHDESERGQSNLVQAGPVLEIGSDVVRLELQALVGGLRREEVDLAGQVSHPQSMDFGVGAFLKGRFPFGEPAPVRRRGEVRGEWAVPMPLAPAR